MQTRGLLCAEMHGPLPPPLPLRPLLLALLPLSKGTVVFPGSALANVCMHGMRPESLREWKLADLFVPFVPWKTCMMGQSSSLGSALPCLGPLS